LAEERKKADEKGREKGGGKGVVVQGTRKVEITNYEKKGEGTTEAEGEEGRTCRGSLSVVSRNPRTDRKQQREREDQRRCRQGRKGE